MSTAKATVRAADSEQKWVYRVGGLSALAIGIAYIIIILLYARVGAPPIGGQAWLEYLTGKTSIWWAIIDVSILTNFLFVPVAFALFVALQKVNRNVMLIAVTFVGLFVVLELAVNWSSYVALVMLSVDYAAATSDEQRAIYIAAASYPSAVLASPLALIYAIGTLSFGFLLTGLVMINGVFNKVTAYVGVITGLLGLVAVAGWSLAVILNATFATIWLLLVGVRLNQLAQQ